MKYVVTVLFYGTINGYISTTLNRLLQTFFLASLSTSKKYNLKYYKVVQPGKRIPNFNILVWI